MTDHQQAALTAMQDEIYRQLNCQYGDFNTPSNEEVKAILAAAEPHLRKKVRAEVAAEIRASLPRDLAASTQDLGGWFSGMTGDLDIVVEVDEDMVLSDTASSLKPRQEPSTSTTLLTSPPVSRKEPGNERGCPSRCLLTVRTDPRGGQNQ